MMAARIFTGLFGGLIGAQVLSIIGDCIPYERRGRAMGLLMGGFALASIVGVPIGLKLANSYAWYYPFLIVAIVGTVVFPFLLKYIPKVNAHLQNPVILKERIQNFKNIFSNKAQITALIFSTLMVMGHFIIIPLINPFMVNNVLVPIEKTPLIYLVGGVSSILTASIVGRLADKYGKRKVFVLAAIISILFIFIITNMPQWNIVLVLTLFALWFSSATSRMVPGQAMTTQVVTAATRGGFMSLNSCLQSLGTGVATLTSGWVTYSDANHKIHHYSILGYISIALILLCIYYAYKLDKFIIANPSK
jgi:predicted MFS family arabinose efflux permease